MLLFFILHATVLLLLLPLLWRLVPRVEELSNFGLLGLGFGRIGLHLGSPSRIGSVELVDEFLDALQILLRLPGTFCDLIALPLDEILILLEGACAGDAIDDPLVKDRLHNVTRHSFGCCFMMLK